MPQKTYRRTPKPKATAFRWIYRSSHPESSLWSLESPTLCTPLNRLFSVDGKPVDSVRTPFGIRTIRFDAEKGFFLNGKSVKIQGTCNHQDFIGVGTAMPDSVLYWRVKKLKEMGCNAIRMSHNPPAPEFLDACDKLGVMVMDENRHLGDTQNPKTGKGTGTADLSDLREMILRDRNHPSIIMWSMCNEEPLQGTADGKRIFAAMMDDRPCKWDTTRPITCAMNGGWGSGISDVEDLQGHQLRALRVRGLPPEVSEQAAVWQRDRQHGQRARQL